MYLPFDPAILFPGIYPTEMLAYDTEIQTLMNVHDNRLCKNKGSWIATRFPKKVERVNKL